MQQATRTFVRCTGSPPLRTQPRRLSAIRWRPTANEVAVAVRRALVSGGVLAALLGWWGSAWGITISLDFSGESVIFSDPTARDAALAAAADISSAITSSLNPISADVWQGRYQSTTATFDFHFLYADPTLGPNGSVEISQATVDANAVRVVVRSRNIVNATILGEGGHAGFGGQIQLNGFPNQAPTAVANAASKAETAYLRGGAGPTIGTLRSNASTDVWNGIPFPYEIDYGAALGALWIDSDANNDGLVDTPQSLANHWHFNHATPVPAGKFDLYSVVLHELLHILGFGSSATWNSLVQGSQWLGAEASAWAGSGSNLITGDHIVSGKMSSRLVDGGAQEVLMDPSLERGMRKKLTLLDLAFLRDLGWQTAMFEVPGDFNADGSVNRNDYLLWAGAASSSSVADADNDGDSDGSDFLIWQRNRGQGASGARFAGLEVPEAATVYLALTAWLAALRACVEAPVRRR